MSSLSSQHIFALMGPTASGKSGIAFELAKHYPVDIINIDSLQVYKHLNIGTAKPSEHELQQCKHHMFSVIDPDQDMSATGYAQKVWPIIKNIQAQKRIALLVGGSGFYLQALSNSKSYPPGYDNSDTEKLYASIQKTHPHIAKDIHANDHYRIGRVSYLIHHVSDFDWLAYTQVNQNDNIISFAIEWPREQLYKNINQRVESMFAHGIAEETKSVLQQFPKAYAKMKKTIGYAQVLSHIEGEYSLERAKELIQQKTRNYAKRQTTWFKHRGNTQWFSYQDIFAKMAQVFEAESL